MGRLKPQFAPQNSGAYDFLEKPLSIEKTLIAVKNAIESRRLQRENDDLKKQLQAKASLSATAFR